VERTGKKGVGGSRIGFGKGQKLVTTFGRHDSGGFKEADEFFPREVVEGRAGVRWGVGEIDREAATQKDDDIGGGGHFEPPERGFVGIWPESVVTG